MPWPPETAIFAVSEEVARTETLFDAAAERFAGRAEEDPDAGPRSRRDSRLGLRSTMRRSGPGEDDYGKRRVAGVESPTSRMQ